MNGTRAYMKLHPKSSYDAARANAPAWLAKTSVKAEIKRRLDERAMSAEEAIYRLGEMGRAELYPFIRIDDEGFVYFNFADEDAKRYLFLIKKIKTKRERRIDSDEQTWEGEWVEVELHDSQAALRDILKMHGKLDRPEKPVEVKEAKPLVIPADLIAPDFFASHRAILSGKYSKIDEYGGRGSAKSSFVSVEIPQLLVNDPTAHALAMRQVKGTLRDSVFAQIEWAINQLGLEDSFTMTTNPMEMTYKPTGQKIYFRGADDPMKIKSIKPPFGAIKVLWFEELPEFHGPEAIRSITQSAIRGTDNAITFKSWNPPRTSGNWVNKYIQMPDPSCYRHQSDYRTVPVEWLGKVFIDDAEFLKSVNPAAYEHEYLGAVNGLGDQVFENLQIRAITDDEIAQFDNVLNGLDFGFYPHPAHYAKTHYDAARHILYIFGEVRKWKTSNADMYQAMLDYGYRPQDLLICDSAEPKSVDDFRAYGATSRGAEKGQDSVKYSMKWLQSLTAIVIDPVRCPYSTEEFTDYAYERTKDGDILEAYPREKDDAIAAARYSTNLIWRRRGQ
jgi:PBSX family phage terminase large subunit